MSFLLKLLLFYAGHSFERSEEKNNLECEFEIVGTCFCSKRFYSLIKKKNNKSGKRLNESEKDFIINLKNEGVSIRKIAKLLKRSDKVVRNYLKLGKKYGIQPPTKGNSKLTARQKASIRKEATKKSLKLQRH